MATPDIAVKSLEELFKNSGFEVLAAVTQIDRPKGRGNKPAPPPVKVFAEQNGIACYQTEKISRDEQLIKKLKELNPDFFVTFAFGQILSQKVLDIPRFCTVNLHASLLPKYRGANPIQRCIYNGDKVTGITTMITELGLDSGDICETKEIEVTENMTSVELKDIICNESPDIICSTLEKLYNKTLIPQKQSSEGVCKADKFIKQDGLINWNSASVNIHNQVRSMVDFPTAYTFYNGKMLKILETRLLNSKAEGTAPNEIICVDKSGITVGTKDGCILITKVKPDSRSIMSAFDYANGAKLKPKMKFGV